MNLFYTRPENITGDVLKLVDQEAKHVTKVLRHRLGDNIYVTNGIGTRFSCEITEILNNEIICSIIESEEEVRSSPFVTLAIGLIKKRDRLEFAVEKATELGVDKIILFRGDHSEKGNVRMDRIEATVLSAMKQSLRNYLPKIIFAESLSETLSITLPEHHIVYADETEKDTRSTSINKNPICLVVGPEGGFSKKESELLREKGGEAYSLGDKRLRTETAAVAITDRYKNSLQ